MKRVAASILLCLAFLACFSQDEGAVVKKERIQLDKGIFVGGGISMASGSNIGDYSTGINFEGGYMVRLNRVVSVGGSISYLSFKYDENIINSTVDLSGTAIPRNLYYDTNDSSPDDAVLLYLTGGDLSIISLAANLKFNFVPVRDNSVISVYAFAKPFIASTTMSAVSGVAEYYYYDSGLDQTFRDPSGDGSGTYDSKSSITGGVFLGPGIEYNPAKAVSFFAQASFGYTFPLQMVSTRSYGNDYNDLFNPEFPIQTLGFTSINFAVGVSFNLD